MSSKHGNLSIHSENIFPIIKKWLYSDHDIFYRELISNGCDAITKLKKLDMMGEYTLPEDYKSQIQVTIDPSAKTIRFEDNGLGMTAQEVEEYINQIAFSGATDFIEKYKDKANDDQIIGHFGLGFYSSFMVAKEVHIDTLSYVDGSVAVHWECDGGTEYDMSEGTKETVGTSITLFLNDDCLEFANEYKAREIIKKYCAFMPVPIYLQKAEELRKEDSQEQEDGKKQEVVALNDTNPLWNKHPNECSREEYLEFYRKVFMDYKEPLFWIHLNMDYPFHLKGILYFPKINMEYESMEGTIKLYNNQVFIADNIKEVIPEFLLLLKGVIDCPDLPLNVSRSALQNDGFVKKISEYITKKVADKLSGMCKTEKEEYEKHWESIHPFIKYGCLKDNKFCEKMTDYILFKDLEGKYLTLPECLAVEKIDIEDDQKDAADSQDAANDQEEVLKGEVVDSLDEDEQEDDQAAEKEKVIYYVTDLQQQAMYVQMFKKAKIPAVYLTDRIDQPFLSHLESRNEGVHFRRIDADVNDEMRAKVSKKADAQLRKQEEELAALFKKAIKKSGVAVKLDKLKNKDISAMLTLSEESRRMQDMMKMYAMPGMDMGGMDKEGATLVLNANHALVQSVLANPEGENTELICQQLYDLALLGNAPLESDAMQKFLDRSNKIMLLLASERAKETN